jgi:hypothetical protein
VGATRTEHSSFFRPFGDIFWYSYSCIAACDVYGFILPTVLREAIVNSTGPVDTECIVERVENKLVPVLVGGYSKGEPRSVVVMDDVIRHDPRVRATIFALFVTVQCRFQPH